jgi:D-alanyl-D-alanine carboxypeptidase (penicillin-binding protein 5/6)
MILIFMGSNYALSENVIDLEIEAKSAILIEASTGKVLYEMNSHEKLPPASVTKVMTLLLIMEALETGKININDTVVCSDYAASMGGSQVYLESGEQMTVHEMLKAITLASGNDASVAMAEHICGSEQAFVKVMNERALELGMKDTNFINSNGLDDDNHYTTAHDIALMSKELLKYPMIHEYFLTWMDSLREGEFELVNTNSLIRNYRGANGIKTGSTDKALFCLSASAKRDDMSLIAVIMAAPTSKSRFNGASRLLDYGFANYAILQGTKKGEVIGTVEVLKGKKENIEVIAADDINILVKKDMKDKVKKEVNIVGNVIAPIDKGQKTGEIVYYVEDEKINTVDLVTTESVGRDSLGGMMFRLMKTWLNA